MIIGITGNPGEGKSLLSALLAHMMADTGCQVYDIKGTFSAHKNITDCSDWTFKEVMEITRGVVIWDEIGPDMDSRNFKSINSQLYTAWIAILRHKGIILIYLCQHPSQVDLRLRMMTDQMWFVRSKGMRIEVQTANWLWEELGRKFIIEDKRIAYKLYDSFADIKPIKMPALPKPEFKKSYERN